ncbi:Zinc finger C-x8-C-x5-C-x3-H type family protein [Hibiscus syriacus]|uniref:Zinc finger C-x8-C-x5-C-x3-H type family protein n=1 Tax=Hibiscus syriacus TaxID=106335 RepID=A0A6A2XAV7_HIBSY|nr:Zinc finger C-x8-C-x5-C-x3-H type family protein [Hibiscus syriacus]
MVEGKLFKTKLCVLYQRGRCSRQSCSFAHGDADLRGVSGSYGGKRNYRNGDLRDKLDRRLSPERRYSPRRDARDRQTLRGYSPLRSIDKKRNRKKKERLDGQSVFSEKLKISNEIEDPVIEGRNISSTSKSFLEDQLKEVHLDIDMLIHRKHELETFVEEKVQEADTLSSQVEELASQLEKEKEECKRSQARLQKSGEQLGLNISGTSRDEENSNINIVSDDETNGLHASYPQKALRGNTSPSKKRLWSNKDIPEGPIHDGKGCPEETIRSGKRSRWSERPTHSNIDKENGSVKNGNSDTVPSASNEKLRKGKRVSVRTSTVDKLKDARASISLPSTSMAAHADDDDVLEVEEQKFEASRLPFLLPPPPPILRNSYSRYKGNDQDVNVDGEDVDGEDVDGVDEEMVHVDII